MDTFISLLVVSIILLVPLVPAAVLYKVLTPKNIQESSDANTSKGEVGGSGFRLQFNVVGSSATYIVLVAAAFLMYDRITERQIALSGMSEQIAWLVEVPIKLQDQNKKELPANKMQLDQVRLEVEPSWRRDLSDTLRFYVVPDNNRFPEVRLFMPDGSMNAVLDLNNPEEVYPDYNLRTLKRVAPVWLAFGTPYEGQIKTARSE